MKGHFYTSGFLLLFLLLLCFGCNEDDDFAPTDIRTMAIAPVARAGNDTTLYQPYRTCILDGSASTDLDNNIVSYQWRLIAGPDTVRIRQYRVTDAKAYASNLIEAGRYDFELTVTDADKLSSKDTVSVTVKDPKNEPICSDPKELIFNDLVWDYSWIMEIDIFDFSTYFPPNSRIQNIYIKREDSDEWEPVVYLGQANGYSLHTWDYGNGLLVIFPNQNMTDDTPDLKIEYCD